METMGDRITTLFRQLGISQKELAKKVGVSNGTITNWKNDSTKPGSNDMDKLADALNTTPKYLLYGDSLVTKGSDLHFGTFDYWDDETEVSEDDVIIPYYKEIEVAAGSGAVNQVIEFTDKKLRFSLRTLRKHGVDPENAVCAVVRGDSMAGEIRDGDAIGIDKGRREIKDGRIYAVDHCGMLRVKYLHKTPQGLKLRSHNKNKEAYPDEIIPFEELEDSLTVLGWVFWKSTTYAW